MAACTCPSLPIVPFLGEFFVQPGMPEKLYSDLAVSQRGLGADFCLEMHCSKDAPAMMGLGPAFKSKDTSAWPFCRCSATSGFAVLRGRL